MLARQALYYPISFGERKWKRGDRFQHPGGGDRFGCMFFRDDRGFLFHFVNRGTLVHRVAGKTIATGPGDGIVLDLQQPVEYSADQPVQFSWLWFDGFGLAALFDSLRLGNDPLFRGLNRACVAQRFRELERVQRHEPPGYEVQYAASLTALLAELCRVRPPPALPTRRGTAAVFSQGVREALWVIAGHYDKRWSIKQLSQWSGLTRSHFSRLFHHETGYTPLDYLNCYRVAQAKMLLATTKTSINEIARRVGVPDPTRFTQIFRNVTGQSPRAFRSAPRSSHAA